MSNDSKTTDPESPSGARTLDSLPELEEFLSDLNYEHECGHTAFLAKGVLYSAFCTDPDARWILETGDPRQRMEYLGGDEEATYVPLELSELKGYGPFTVLHAPEVTR